MPLFKGKHFTSLLNVYTNGVRGAQPEPPSVVYVLFLETNHGPFFEERSWLERVIEIAIVKLTPSPAIAHCELLVPPTGTNKGRNNFATYLGTAGAHWQNREGEEEGRSYYLESAGGRWRAIPVSAHNLCARTLRVCESTRGAPYSLNMYLTSIPPLRRLGRYLYSDTPLHKGHCATITARVLINAGVKLKHRAHWYSPGSLYAELNSTAALVDRIPVSTSSTPVIDALLPGSLYAELNRTAAPVDTIPVSTSSTPVIDALLRGVPSPHGIRLLGEDNCNCAIEELSRRASHASSVELRTHAQKDLAKALLVWVMMRPWKD
jgi:hypothetical protein